MAQKKWRIQIYDVGEVVGGTVDITITDAHLLEPPIVGGQRVLPLEGRAESISWSALVGDFSELITGDMTDGAGSMDLVGRVADVAEDTGGGFSNVWAGRVSGLYETGGPGAYRVQFADERWLERGVLAHQTTNGTVRLYPNGFKSDWHVFKASEAAGEMVVEEVSGNYVRLSFLSGPPTLNEDQLRFLTDDLKDDYTDGNTTTSNWKTLKAFVGGQERPLVSFGPRLDSHPLSGVVPLSIGMPIVRDDQTGQLIRVWIYWPTGTPGEMTVEKDFTLYADDSVSGDPAPTSAAFPVYLGGADGIDLIQAIKDEYDTLGLRYESNAFSTWDESTNPNGLLGHPLIPAGWMKFDQPVNLGQWTDSIYAALSIVPFVNSSGEITPRLVHLQHDVDPTTLTEITDGNVSDPATFEYEGSEAVTVIQGSALRLKTDFDLRPLRKELLKGFDLAHSEIRLEPEQVPEITHPNTSTVGRRVHSIDLPFMISKWWNPAAVTQYLQQQAREIFDRWANGPIFLSVSGLDALDALDPGDWARVTLSNYPVFTSGSRDGTTFLAQVIEKRRSAFGPSLRLLSGGKDDQPLSAPSVAIAQNTVRAEHDVDITISGLDASADHYQLQTKTGSGPWVTVAEGTANETVTRRNYPSNTSIQTRVRAIAEDTIRSAWSTTDSVTTAALTAPSAPSATATNRRIDFTWTNGETDYEIMLTLDGADFLTFPLPAGTTGWTFVGLDASTLYTLGVKHIDPYGGESALVTDTATTGTASALSAPSQLQIVQGAAASTDIVYPTDKDPVPEGFELSWRKAEPHLVTVVQHDTNASFTDPETIYVGVASRVVIEIPVDNTTRHFRARHELPDSSFTASAWTATVSAQPVPLRPSGEAAVADGFAGGYAFLSLDTDNDVILNVGTADPDADTFYYELNKTSFTEPTTGSSSVASSAMPFSADQTLILGSGETAFLWGKFHSDTKGFGQSVQHKITAGAISQVVTSIETSFDENGEAVVSATGGGDTANLYVTVGDGSAPANPNATTNDGAISGATGTVATGVKVTTGNEAFVKVVAENSDGTLGPVASARFGRLMGPFHKDTTTRSTPANTSENTLETITVPANKLGTNGGIMLWARFEIAGTANTKTIRVKFGGSPLGTIVLDSTVVGLTTLQMIMFNDGATNDQDGQVTLWNAANLVDVDAAGTAVDTTASADITITGELGTATDDITLVMSYAHYIGTN